MKIYSEYGFREMHRKDILDYASKERIKIITTSVIKSARLLQREFLGNIADSLDGCIKIYDEEGVSSMLGFNIGGNNKRDFSYIPFLKEIGCKKNYGLYDLDSLKDKEIGILIKGEGINRFPIGYFVSHSWFK